MDDLYDANRPAPFQGRRRVPLNSHQLTILFGEREDIVGVSHVADFITESVRWCA